MWPWLDRTGHFSTLRAAVFALILLPALWLALEACLAWLGPRPATEAIHQSGLWAIRLLAATLAITPLRAATRWSKLIGLRRMLGVSVFCYAALHLALYGLDQHFDLPHIAAEIVLRIYLAIGFIGFVLLCILTATSTDAAIKRLGPEKWARLHRWVYGIAALGTVHFFMQSKADVSEPIMMGGLFALLMPFRLPLRGFKDPTAWGLTALALGSSLATALFEAAWYAVAKGAPFFFVLESNIDFSFAIHPAWYVLAAGLTLVLARLTRPWFGGAGSRRAAASGGRTVRDYTISSRMTSAVAKPPSAVR